MADVMSEIRALMQERFSLTPEQLAPEKALANLGIDSLGALEFMFELEDKFGISFGEDRDSVVTVGDVAAVVQRALDARGHAA
jgi:acyl carrier protein